ncbi:MAG: hypothetical protein F4226_02980 [Synechococcus sp. SB0678_bin_12]|nr:hypothetical protein [Synechococcus sp. SB0678_bin_12]
MKLHIKSQPFSTAKQFFAQTFKKLVWPGTERFSNFHLNQGLILVIGLLTLFPFTSTQPAHAATRLYVCNMTDQDIDVSILDNFYSIRYLRSYGYKRVKSKDCGEPGAGLGPDYEGRMVYFNVRQFSYSTYDNYWCIDTTTDTTSQSAVVWDGDRKNPYFKETERRSRNTTANKLDIFDRCSNLGPSYRMVGFKDFSSGSDKNKYPAGVCMLIFYNYGEYISIC